MHLQQVEAQARVSLASLRIFSGSCWPVLQAFPHLLPLPPSCVPLHLSLVSVLGDGRADFRALTTQQAAFGGSPALSLTDNSEQGRGEG